MVLALLIGAIYILFDFLQRRMSEQLIQKVLVGEKLRIQENIDRFDGTLRDAEAGVLRFARLISQDESNLPSHDSKSFESILHRDADGSWRVPRSRFDSHRDANAWIPPDVPLTEQNRLFYLRSLEITAQFGNGVLNDLLVNTWMLPLSNGMTAFWPDKPDYLYDASSDLDYRKTPWVTLTDPKLNPKHEPRWVGPEYDAAAKDWSISVVAPFFRRGQWAGSVGHDMVASKLLGRLLSYSASNAAESLSRPLFVASETGRLMAKPFSAPRFNERVPLPYRAALASSDLRSGLRVIPDGRNYLVIAPIPTLRAKALYLVDGNWLRRSLQEELVVMQLAGGLFLMLMFGSVVGFALKDSQARQKEKQWLEESNMLLMQQSRLDNLTSLPNRLGLIEAANLAISRVRRNGTELLVVFLDLDRFKQVNDSLGHDKGDLVLVQVAKRLREAVRDNDTVARLGGDEFVLIIEDLSNKFDAGHLAEKLHQAFRVPLLLDGKPIVVTPSIGISIFPDDGQDIDTLMRQADMAMYEVKASGRDSWLFFTDSMNSTVQERLLIERDMLIGLDRGEFRLDYQPQWTIDGLRLTGWESLIRWHHPERGIIAPDIFIPVAEDTGMINEIGIMVLDQSCREAVNWRRSGLGNFGISVNISARQFVSNSLEQQIESALLKSGLEPSLLELEITESVLMDNPNNAMEVLTRLRMRGIRVAIDDFGTGYSSLSYLSRFPVDRLKIDRSFVTASLLDSRGATIVEAVISLSNSLGLSAIAEGVETKEQLQFLNQHGCEQIQGYLSGPPMAAGAIADYLSLQATSKHWLHGPKQV